MIDRRAGVWSVFGVHHMGEFQDAGDAGRGSGGGSGERGADESEGTEAGQKGGEAWWAAGSIPLSRFIHIIDTPTLFLRRSRAKLCTRQLGHSLQGSRLLREFAIYLYAHETGKTAWFNSVSPACGQSSYTCTMDKRQPLQPVVLLNDVTKFALFAFMRSIKSAKILDE
jgi:hypothetical protein